MMNSIFNFTKQLNNNVFLPPKFPVMDAKALHEKGWDDKLLKIGEKDEIPCLKFILTLDGEEVNEAKDGKALMKTIDLYYFHGNAENIFNCWERVVRILDLMTDKIMQQEVGVNMGFECRVFIPEYPGYVSGQVDNLTNWDIHEWSQTIAKSIHDEKSSYDVENNTSNRVVILWGYSLGAGYATRVFYALEKMPQIIKTVPDLVMVLEAPFYSLQDTIQEHAGFFHRQACNFLWSENDYEYFPTGKILEGTYAGSFPAVKQDLSSWSVVVYCAREDKLCGYANKKFAKLASMRESGGKRIKIERYREFDGWSHESFAGKEETNVIFQDLWKHFLELRFYYEYWVKTWETHDDGKDGEVKVEVKDVGDEGRGLFLDLD